jgi:hypothetical protein
MYATSCGGGDARDERSLGMLGGGLRRERAAARATDAPHGRGTRDDWRSVPGVHTVELVRDPDGDVLRTGAVVT